MAPEDGKNDQKVPPIELLVAGAGLIVPLIGAALFAYASMPLVKEAYRSLQQQIYIPMERTISSPQAPVLYLKK
jgi:hypothetical protein